MTPSPEPTATALSLALLAYGRDGATLETGDPLTSATVIVCNPNAFMKQLHNRMPAILSGEAVESWLKTADTSLLGPAPGGMLRAWPVNPRVNSSRYEAADAIETVGEELAQV